MPTFLRKLFEQYAKRLLTNKVRPSILEEGIMTIPNNKRVTLMAENLYKDFKKAGVPDNILKTENDIKVFHHKIAEMNNENVANRLGTFEDIFAPKKPAEVFDLKGNKIKNPNNIMGGEEMIDPNSELAKSIRMEAEAEKKLKKLNMSDKEIDLRGDRPYDTDEQIKKRLMDQNKKSSTNIKNNRQLTDEEIRDYELELGDSETWLNKGTFGEAEQALKNQKAYEAKMFAEYKSIGGSKRPDGPNASKKDSLPIRLMKNFEKELNEADLMAEGYSKDQANVLIKARQKMISGEEMNPNESLLRVKEEFADNAGVDVEDFTDIDFEIDIPDYAKGGRAGFYTGGITDVEPSLDDIGHGTDALNARTRLMSPGNQATTSTGLNYLLAEDNDNMRIPFASGGSNPLMPMQNQQALNDLFAPFQKAPQTDYSNMMNKQSVYTPFNSGRIKDEFDEKTQTAFDEGAQISTQEFKNEPFDFTKDEFGKQGYSSDIRHGLGSSAFKDAVIDYMTSNLGVNANTNLFKGITPENFGSFAANAGSLFTEVPDMFSQAQAVAKSKGPYGSIDDYGDEPDTRFLTQPIEDIKANYVGSKIPFSLRNNLQAKKYFIDNFNKYGNNTMDQLKLFQKTKMKDQIKTAEAMSAVEEARVAAELEKAKKRELSIQTLKEASRNRNSGIGGYQSSFSQDKSFMRGPGSSKEMGSFADGGRIGFSAGGGGRRAFLKLLASIGGGAAAFKSGLLSLGEGGAKKAITETVKQSTGTPPPYFFKLAEKIKMLGDDVTVGSSTMPRTKVTKYKNYELTENLDGSKQIQKIGKEDDMITKNEYMTYTKGQADETTKGKKPADEYEEVTETNSRIYKDNFNDPDYEDGIELSEILEEVGETVTKKAYGGRIGFSDAGFVDEALTHYNKYLASRKARPPKKRYKEIPFLKFFEEFSKENRADGGRIGFADGIAGMLGE